MTTVSLALLLPAYVAGVLVAAQISPVPDLPLYVILCGLCWLLFRRHRLALPILALFFFALGSCLFQLCRHPSLPDGDIVTYDGQTLTLDATIAELTQGGDGFRLDLDALTIVTPGPPRPASGRVRLHLDTAKPFGAGDRIRVKGKVRRPRLFVTPGEFDSAGHLAISGLFARLQPATDQPPLLLVGDRGDYPLANRRLAVGSLIDASVPGTTAPLVRSLAIGDSGSPPEIVGILARGGLSHLFSISGLHLGLIAAALYGIGLSLWRRLPPLHRSPPARFLPFVIAPLLVLYLFWSGNAHATQRALLMAVGAAGLLVLRRRTTPLRLLAAAVFVMLLVNPLALFAPSLQLSVCGIAGIILFQPVLARHLGERPPLQRIPLTLLATTAAATLATLPVVLYHFHLLAPAGLIVNLFAIPIVSWLSVPLAMFGVLLQPLSAAGAALCYAGCGETIRWVLAVTKAVLALPGCGGTPLYLTLTTISGTALLALAVLLPRCPLPLRTVLVCGAATAILLPPPCPPVLAVTALSVGQGESLLLTPDGRSHLLIDGGGLYGEGFDTGERLVAPALGRLGATTLRAVVMTHTHPDHSKGLLHILATLDVGEFWLGAETVPDEALAATLAARKIPLRRFAPGWTDVDTTPDRRLAVFAAAPADGNENDRSLVIYAGNRRDGVLLTADLEATGVAQLLASPPPGPVTLLKLPHHGSRNSTPIRLVDALAPEQTFVSAGRDNRFRFPHDDVVTALASRGIPLARTDRDGTVQFVANRDGWLQRRWQAGLFR